MNLETRLAGSWKAGRSRIWIAVGVFVLVAVAVTFALLVVDLAKDRPNLYDPARVALVEAQRNLSEAYGHAAQEKALYEQVQAVHRSLDQALTLLGNAERLDPSDRAMIDSLRARLTLLEDDQKILHTPDSELRRSFQELSEEMQKLIERRE